MSTKVYCLFSKTVMTEGIRPKNTFQGRTFIEIVSISNAKKKHPIVCEGKYF